MNMTGHNRNWQKRLLSVLMTAVLALSMCILAFAASSATLTNAYLTLDSTTGLPTDYSFDFHPNASGHEVIADVLAAAYEDVLSGEATESGDNTNFTPLIILIVIGLIGIIATCMFTKKKD